MNSGSPPNKTTLKDPATLYTPSSAQKRFNPFMKDMGKTNDDSSSTTLEHKLQTSPIHKKPLTPTNEHPLKDLERNKKAPKSEFLDSSDEKESIDEDGGDEKVDTEKEIDAKEDTTLTDDTHIVDNDIDDANTNIKSNQILLEMDNQQHLYNNNDDHHQQQQQTPTTIISVHPADDDNKNNNMTESDDGLLDEDNNDDDGEEKQKPVVKRTKKASTNNNNNNNNNNNVKNNNNNNRLSYPMGKSQLNKSHQRLDDSLSKSTDKLDGEYLFCRLSYNEHCSIMIKFMEHIHVSWF